MSLQSLWLAVILVGVCRGLFLVNNPPPRRPAGDEVRSTASHLYIQQKVDHFDVANTATWAQSYWRNDEFYVDGGPIFVTIASAEWSESMTYGLMFDLAESFNATSYSLTSRFYSDQWPTADISVENLRFLSIEQDLGDIAFFLEEIRTIQPGSKVILFGVSQGGALATWTRVRYPHLVDGIVASSAPLLAQVDFPEYLDALADVLKAADENCVQDIKTATDDAFLIMSQPHGSEVITSLLNLCAPLDTNNKMEIAVIFSSVASLYAENAKYAEILDYVTHACGYMTDPKYGATPLARLGNLFHMAAGDCVEVSYKNYYLERLRNTSWGGGGDRPGFYQKCTTFGRFHTSSSNQPFGDHFSSADFQQACMDIFGPSFTRETLELGVHQTNLMFGGLQPAVTNALFTHGSLDPERFVQVTQNLSETATAIRIEGSTYAKDFYPPLPTDSPEVKAARVKINETIQLWL